MGNASASGGGSLNLFLSSPLNVSHNFWVASKLAFQITFLSLYTSCIIFFFGGLVGGDEARIGHNGGGGGETHLAGCGVWG